jgi:hypothetical protein
MMDHLATWNLGVIFQKLADRIVDLGQIVLIPSSVSLWKGSVVGGCHCDGQEEVSKELAECRIVLLQTRVGGRVNCEIGRRKGPVAIYK